MVSSLDFSILHPEPTLLCHLVKGAVIGRHRFCDLVYLDDHLCALLDEDLNKLIYGARQSKYMTWKENERRAYLLECVNVVLVCRHLHEILLEALNCLLQLV